MERLKSTTIIFLLAVGLFTSAAPAKPASVLLQEGLYAEEIEGDLDGAIKIYEQVIAKAKEAQRVAAQATYRIGTCYLKKGQKDKAAEHFQNIIVNFPSQKALVTKAEKQLDKIKSRAERIVEKTVITISTCAEGDPRVAQALESLKGLDESAVVSELVKFLDSETDTVRRSTIYILWRGNLSDISAAVPVLEKLCSHEEELTRGMAALALGQAKVNSSFDTLCDMTLKDNSGYARRCGAIALGWMGRADAKPILEKALGDPDPLVCNNAKAALAMLPEKVRASARSFGQVIERVINDDGEEKNCMIDFESGQLFAFPENLKDLPMDDTEVQDWLEQKGIDAIAAMNGKLGGLEGVRGLRAVSMRDLGWDALPDKLIATIEREIALHPTLDKAGMFAFGGIPFDFFFKTGDGGMGVLQLLEVHSPHIGTRIRYKMLQKPDVRGLSVSSHRRLLDEQTLIAINRQDEFGAKWFKVEHEYEAASQSKKQQMIEKWMSDAQKPDVTIRSGAIASLGNIACKQAADVLMKIAKEPMEFSRSNRPRWIAVRGLGRIGDMRAVPVLIDLLDHYNKDTQLYSRVALAEITGLYFGADKAKWRKWWGERGEKLAELDLGSPQSTVINFTKAAIAGHVELALACFAPDSYDYEDVKELLTGAETNPLRMMLGAVDPDARIIIVSMEMAEEGTRCSIKWRMFLRRGFTIEGKTFKAGETFDLDGNLKKVGDRWLIVGI